MADGMRATPQRRCTPRKHVIERDTMLCDCGMITACLTAGKNAYVVSILDFDAIAEGFGVRSRGCVCFDAVRSPECPIHGMTAGTI